MSYESVSIDIEALRRLVGHVRDAFDTLFLGGNALYAYLDDLDLPIGPATTVRTAAWWADEQVLMLDRRLSLAEGIDTYDNGLVKPSSNALAEFPTRAAAERAGRDLASRTRDGDGNPDLSTAELDELMAHVHDPDYLRGFYDELGPAGLARLAGDTVQDGSGDYDPARAQEVLGHTFAAYTRTNTVDEAWLGQFNHLSGGPTEPGHLTSFESNVLAQLLPHGTYSSEFLTMLGDRLYGGDRGDVRDTGWGNTFGRGGTRFGIGSVEAETTPLAYHAAVLEAIAEDPTIAASFTDRHLEGILAESRAAASTYAADPDDPRVAALTRLEDARAELVRAGVLAPTLAGSATLPDAALPTVTNDAETLVARLAFLQNADGGHVSAAMQQTYGDILHHYTDDVYQSVTSPLPITSPLLDAEGLIVAEWPASGPGDRIPQELWSALLVEALRNPANLEPLLEDAEAAAGGVAQPELARSATAGPENHVDMFRLSAFQVGLVNSFFLGALGQTARGLGEDVDELVEATREFSVKIAAIGVATVAGGPVGGAGAAFGIYVEQLVGGGFGSLEEGIGRADRDYIAALQGASLESTWRDEWERGVREMWVRQNSGSNPFEPTTVTIDPGAIGGEGISREYTGDPVHDRYVSARGAADDFLLESGEIMELADMSPAQLAAYEAWLFSPAVVANNHRAAWVIESGRAGNGAPEGSGK